MTSLLTKAYNTLEMLVKARFIKYEKEHDWLTRYGLIISVVTFTVSTSWLADSFPIHKLEDTNPISLLFAAILTLISVVLFNRYKTALCSTSIINSQRFQPHDAVITLLSGQTTFTSTDPLLRPESLEEAIEKSETEGHVSKHVWRQALRALYKNPNLKHLYVISSTQNSRHFNDYKSLIQYYRPNLVVHHITPAGIDFESLKEVNDAISEAIKHAKSDNFDMVDIAIDITGGQKTASIAAANFTLEHKDLEFFYVATGDELKIISYNAISTKSEAPAS
jgi:hypothetical protein